MAKPSIFITLEVSDGRQGLKRTWQAVGEDDGHWWSANERGHNSRSHPNEQAARARIADELRKWGQLLDALPIRATQES
jgi:hypothetical protein